MLAEYQGKVPERYPSQEMLAVPLGVKVRQLQSFIKELESYMRVDPPEPFPLIEAKRVFVEKDRKTRNIYKLLWWPFLALDLKANGAERSYSADGGNAQYPAHRSEGEAQEAAPSPEAMPVKKAAPYRTARHLAMRNRLRILGVTRKILLLRYRKCSVRILVWHRTECHPAIRNPLRIGL